VTNKGKPTPIALNTTRGIQAIPTASIVNNRYKVNRKAQLTFNNSESMMYEIEKNTIDARLAIAPFIAESLKRREWRARTANTIERAISPAEVFS